MLLSKIRKLFPIGSSCSELIRSFAGLSALLIANTAFAQDIELEKGPIKLVVITPDGVWQVDQLDNAYLTMTVKNGVTGEVEAELPLTPCPEEVRKRGACLPTVSAESIEREDLSSTYEFFGDTSQSDLIVVLPVAKLDVPEGKEAYAAAAEILRDACGNTVTLSDCMTVVSDENWTGFLLQRGDLEGQVKLSPLNEFGAITENPSDGLGVFIPQSVFDVFEGVRPVSD